MFEYAPVTAPYPGLRPFEPHEGEIFFGREGHTDRLLEILQRERFLAVIGPSGCGKSSLVRAGLLPALAGGRLGTGSHWRLALLRPGGQPLLALAQALIAPHALGPELLAADHGEAPAPASLRATTVDDATPDAALIAAELRRDGAAGLERLLAQAWARRVQQHLQSRPDLRGPLPPPPPLNLLILADQFEELFTYHDARSDEAESAAFVNLLLAARDRGAVPLTEGIRLVVALTMRTDFLGHCVQFDELPEAINRAQYLTPRLKHAEMRAAIIGPARLFGGDVDSAFTDEIIQRIDANSDQLPLLQHALSRWWRAAEQINHEAPQIDATLTECAGHVDQALDRHASELYAQMPPAEQTACEWLLRAITTGREGSDAVRRPQKLADIATWSGTDITTLKAVITRLAAPDVSFLHHGPRLTDDSVIDLTHEALMRQWKLLQGWIASEQQRGRGWLRWQEKLVEHLQGQADLLSGADLTRALDWWNPSNATPTWQPTPVWAQRYSAEAEMTTLKLFEGLRGFLIESRDAETREREAEQTRLAEEAAAAERRAEHERQLADAAQAAAAEAQRQSAKAQASARRARRLSRIVTAVALAAVLLAVFGWWQYQHAQDAEQRRTVSLFESQLTHASLLARNDDYQEAARVLAESTQFDAAMPPERRHARNLLAGHVQTMGVAADKIYLADGQPLPALDGGVAVSPDGRILAAAGERATLVLYDAESGRLLKRLEGHDPKASTGDVRAIAFAPSGSTLYSAGDDGRVIQWAIPSGDKLAEWKTDSEVRGLAISPDGRQLATGGSNGVITLWSLPEGRELKKLEGHQRAIADSTHSLVYSPDGQRLASTSYDGTARIWNTESGKVFRVFEGHALGAKGVDFDPYGQSIAVSSGDGNITLWRIDSGNKERVFSGHNNRVFGVRFSADGATLYSASRDNTLRAWDVASGAVLCVFQGHEAGLWSVDLAPVAAGGQRTAAWAYTAANDGTLRRWPLAPAARSAWIWATEGDTAATSAAIAPDGRWAAIGLQDGTLRLHALPGGEVLGEVKQAHANQVLRIAFSPDGQRLATGSHDDKAKLWAVEQTPAGRPNLRLLHTIEDHQNSVHAVTFSPDGQRLATASNDGQIGLFDVASSKGQTVKAHDAGVSNVSFSSDGTWFITNGDDYKLRQWSTAHLDQPPRELARLQDIPMWASLAPDGRSVAVVGRDQAVTLLDLTRPEAAVQRLIGHEQTVLRAIHSPDGRQLATVSSDMTLRLWDLDSPRLLFTQRLPAVKNSGQGSALWDFDFRCIPATGECWAVVPLTMGRVAVYRWPYEQFPPGLARQP